MKKIVEDAKKEFGAIEIKKIGHNYYIYKVSSVYDKEKKELKRFLENILVR
ncbi:MAG: hypothetical protein QW046_00420 [Candidatus Micrarchaeaceae archaeon]